MYLIQAVLRIRTLQFLIEKVASKGQCSKSVMNLLRIVLVDSLGLSLAHQGKFLHNNQELHDVFTARFLQHLADRKDTTTSSGEIRAYKAGLAAISEVILKICQREISCGY